MKKVLLVLLVALIAVSAVFAEFDKSKLNINVTASMYAQYGISYDFTDKFEAGVYAVGTAPLYPSTSIECLGCYVFPQSFGLFAEYKVAEFTNSDLSVGADVAFIPEGTYPFVDANAVFSYHFNEHSSVFAKAVWTYGINFCATAYAGGIGYTYTF